MINLHNSFDTRKVSVIALFALIFTVGCLDDDNNVTMLDGPVALVSLYNASPDSPGLDIEVDGNQINFNSFDYGDYSGYLRFYTGMRELRFTPHSADNSVLEATIALEENNVYSVFVSDEFEDISLLVLNDKAEPVASGKVKVRLVNLSPDAGTLDLTIDGDTDVVVNDLSFKGASNFTQVDADSYNFLVRDASNGEVLLNLPDIKLQAHHFYTIVVRGYKTPPDGNSHFLSGQVLLN